MKTKKIIIFHSISLLYLFFSFNLFSITKESYNINDLTPFIQAAKQEDHVLILFDIDDTLIDSPMSLNSGPWINYYWQNAPKLLPEKMWAIAELMWHVSKSVPCLPVDPAIASLIANYQKSALLTPLALTARPIYKERIDGIKVTAQQLLNINIDFSETIPPPSIATHPSFQAGIIYTSGKMKGEFLQELLTSINHHPNRIIFIDDKLDQILSVEIAMNEIGIHTDCLWYRQASLNRQAFDPQIANIQLEYLLKHQLILSDEEAGLLITKKEYSSKTPDDFLRELIEFYEEAIANRGVSH